MRNWVLGVLALTLASPVAAQEWQVARQQFAFAGSRLEITVDVEAEGRLRLLRGGPGAVRVAGRAVSGFTAAGLTHDDELTLSALGDGPVEYMVSVPEGVWVTVRLPGRSFSQSLASHAAARTFDWEGTAATSRAAPARAGPPTGAPVGRGPATPVAPVGATAPVPGPEGLYTTFAADLAPAVVSLPDLEQVRSLSVRVEGSGFRVAASRPLSLDQGDPRELQIVPAAPPMDLVLTIPAGTAQFDLQAEGRTVLRVRHGEVATECAPVTRQRLSPDRRWVTFTPVDGDLRCSTPP